MMQARSHLLKMLSLHVEHAGRSRRYPFVGKTLRVGSDPDNDIVIASEYVSRHHAVFTVADGGVRVEDLDSRNGIEVQGQRVRSRWLEPPAAVRLGLDVALIVADAPTDEIRLHPDVRSAGSAGAAAGRAGPTLSGEPEPSGLASRLLATLASCPRPDPLDVVLREAPTLGLGGAWGLVTIEIPERDGPRSPRSIAGSAMPFPEETWASLLIRLAHDERSGRLGWAAGEAWFRSIAGRGNRPTLVLVGEGEPPEGAEGLLDALAIAVDLRRPRDGNDVTREASPGQVRFSLEATKWIDGTSAVMRGLHARMSSALGSDLPVLLMGETGTGKEIYASALHAQSPRGGRELAAINVSAIPTTLVEATLFGALEGAATGVRRQDGLFRHAHGSTVLLDEIGDLDFSVQAKLLRVLDEGRIQPVGSARSHPVDVRIVAATNRDLVAEVAAGRFRSDLFHRLGGHIFHIPPLRDHVEDIPRYVDAFLADECRRSGRRVEGVTVRAMRRLQAHHWPGNVRELKLLVRRLVHELPDAHAITHRDLPPGLGEHAPTSLPGTLEARLDVVRAALVREALADARGNRSQAAARLGLSRGGLRALVVRLGLDDD